MVRDTHHALILVNNNLFWQMVRLIQALQQSKEDIKQQMLIPITVLDIMEETVSQLVKMVCSLVEVDPELAVETLLLVLTLAVEEQVDIQTEL